VSLKRSREGAPTGLAGPPAAAVATVRRTTSLLPVALMAALAVGGAGFWVQLAADFLGRRVPFWVSEDFTAFYAAGRLVARGAGSLLYHPEVVGAVEHAVAGAPVGGSGVLAYFNPPFFALLFLPLSHLSLGQAYQVWTLANLLLVGVSTWLLWKLAAPLDRRWRLVLAAGFLALYPVTYGLRLGQFSILLVTGSASASLLLRRRRERAAGLALALLLIKPELLVPPALFLIWKRRWRVLQTLVPATLLAVAASVFVTGWRAALAYPGYLLGSVHWQNNGVGTALMFGWNGMIAALWRSGPQRVELLGAALLTLAGLAAAAYVWRGEIRLGSVRFAGQWLVLMLATLLADPHLYLQDTVVAVPAVIAFLSRSGAPRRKLMAAGLLLGWLLFLGYGIVVYESGLTHR
jgi:hypothetical protein